MSSMIGSNGYGGVAGPTGKIGNKIPSGYRSGQMAQFTPEQMQLFQQSFGQVGPESYTSRLAGGDESLFGEIEAPALKQFAGLQGNIASRFSGGGGGRGAMSSRRSSGFQNTMNTAAQDFASQLQQQRQGLQRQAIQDLRGMTNDLLGQRPYENFLTKKEHKQPFWKQALGIASPLGGDIAQGDTKNTESFFNFMKLFGGG